MGYNGMGSQRWIATMKPRKFLGKRTKPDGGGGGPRRGQDVESLYHYGTQDLTYLRQKKYTEKKRRSLLSKLLKEKQQQNIFLIIGLIVTFLVVVLFFVYLNGKFNFL